MSQNSDKNLRRSLFGVTMLTVVSGFGYMSVQAQISGSPATPVLHRDAKQNGPTFGTRAAFDSRSAYPEGDDGRENRNTALPSYHVGVQPNGSIVTSTNQVLTPAGIQIALSPGGTQTAPLSSRVYAVAIRPDQQTVAALVQSSDAPIRIIDLQTNTEVQAFDGAGDKKGSFAGLAYSPDGKTLYASQDDGSVMIMNVAADGRVSLDTRIVLPQDAVGNPNPGGLAVSDDGNTLYVVLNRANALGIIDLQKKALVARVPVGNVPFGVIVSGKYAYVSNEGGRVAQPGEFTVPSSGTAVLADPGSAAASTGTVSVIDLAGGNTIGEIEVGLHPTAMAVQDDRLFVANSNSDSISVIDTAANKLIRTLRIRPFAHAPFGSSPNGIVVSGEHLFVTLGTNNAVAVLRWTGSSPEAEVEGLIPTGSFPGSIALDSARGQLVVGNVKGVGSLGPLRTIAGKTSHSVYADIGTISVISPAPDQLEAGTRKVYANNGWQVDREQARDMKPHAIPLVRGAPSLIRHVFLVVRENRTYDQVFGDLDRGNGDPSLTLFGKSVTPNAHALATRFPLVDNFYDMGRQSADGHQWIVQSINPDYNEKAGPDYVRSYPYNGGDSMTYGPTGWLWQDAVRHGITTRVYGEYANITTLPTGAPASSWSDWYRDSQILEGKIQGPLHLPVGSYQQSTLIPSLNALLDRNFPGFDGNVPDQYRYDVFKAEFDQFEARGDLPQLIIMTLPDDHTTGTIGSPTPAASVADNDLALGRLVDDVSHSSYWKDSVIFVEEDDAQNGVDHVDGHRSPFLVISPYAKLGIVDSTYYTQLNVNSTIEYILGLDPLNQFDLTAAPMSTLFTDSPHLAGYKVKPNQIPLNTLNGQAAAKTPLRKAWAKFANDMFRGKERTPDAEDSNLLNHSIWYATTGFKRPYPGERALLWPAQVQRATGAGQD